MPCSTSLQSEEEENQSEAAVAVAPFEKTGDFKTALTIVMTAMIVTEMEIELIVFLS